jgi:DNA-damage-inducible protein D
MKKEQIQALFQQFESICYVYDGIECWSVRELQKPLDYSKWENFEKVIDKAKEACKNAGEEIAYHFPDVRKVIEARKGAKHEINDILLTRYACYLIAQNGDSRKEKVSFAQNYFAVQTRRAELVEKRLLEFERVKAREKLSQTEKQLSGILYEGGVDGKILLLSVLKETRLYSEYLPYSLKRKWVCRIAGLLLIF